MRKVNFSHIYQDIKTFGTSYIESKDSLLVSLVFARTKLLRNKEVLLSSLTCSL
jgi:hypothetical protein